MAILTKRHTSVIDLDTEALAGDRFREENVFDNPFAQWKKILDDAAARSPRKHRFELSVRSRQHRFDEARRHRGRC